MGYVKTSQLISATPDQVFRYVTDFNHLAETLEGKLQVEVIHAPPEFKELFEFELKFKRFSTSVPFRARVESFSRGKEFTYRQIEGHVFKSWRHVQIFEQFDFNMTRLTDIVEFEMPMGLAGSLLDDLVIRQDVAGLIKARAKNIAAHFASETKAS